MLKKTDDDDVLWWMLNPQSAFGLDIDQPTLYVPGSNEPLRNHPLQFAWWDETLKLLVLREEGEGGGFLLDTIAPGYERTPESRFWPDALVAIPLYREQDGRDCTVDSLLVMADIINSDQAEFYNFKKDVQRQIIHLFMH